MRIRIQLLEIKAESGFWRLATISVAMVGALFAASCAGNSSKDYALAPPPPKTYPIIIERIDAAGLPQQLASIETAAGFPVADDPAALGLDREKVESHCRIQDRFDRKHAIAYQWGQGGQNRIGLDVSGVSLDSEGFEGAVLEYSLRLQTMQPKKERCRYKSSWQGMIGTGYHELFVREQDTVWSDLHKLTDDIDSRLDTLVGN